MPCLWASNPTSTSTSTTPVWHLWLRWARCAGSPPRRPTLWRSTSCCTATWCAYTVGNSHHKLSAACCRNHLCSSMLPCYVAAVAALGAYEGVYNLRCRCRLFPVKLCNTNFASCIDKVALGTDWKVRRHAATWTGRGCAPQHKACHSDAAVQAAAVCGPHGCVASLCMGRRVALPATCHQRSHRPAVHCPLLSFTCPVLPCRLPLLSWARGIPAPPGATAPCSAW